MSKEFCPFSKYAKNRWLGSCIGSGIDSCIGIVSGSSIGRGSVIGSCICSGIGVGIVSGSCIGSGIDIISGSSRGIVSGSCRCIGILMFYEFCPIFKMGKILIFTYKTVSKEFCPF